MKTGWLIEVFDYRERPLWWTASCWSGNEFSYDANEAVRFCRREDAERVIAGKGWKPEKYRATEHRWL
jgi:hypothetical protein